MAYSYTNYPGDGSQVNFAVTWPYLEKSHVKVYVQGLIKTDGVHYNWTNASMIQFTTAPAAGTIISIIRSTSRTERLVDFVTGNILSESTLDLDSNQLFYLMQEAFDALVSASGEDSAIFSTPGAILDAFTGSITSSQLAIDLAAPIGYLNTNYINDAIYEFDGDGSIVFEDEIYAHGYARVMLAESRINLLATASDELDGRLTSAEVDIDAAEAQITLNVTDITTLDGEVDANIAILALMADEFYVKLDANGNVSGFGLYNGETSQFIVNADEFAIIKADGTGATQVPFIVDTVSGLIGIDGNLVVTGSIDAAQIAANAIESDHIAANQILAVHILAGVIDTAHLAADCITAAKIDALAIEAEHISAGIIDTDHLVANAVTAAKIDVATLSAIVADLGIITAGNITLDSSGFIRTSGKDNYADTTAGFFLGYDTDDYKLNLGNATRYIQWDGNKLKIKGDLGGIISGETLRASANTVRSTMSSDYVMGKEIVISRGGTWRVKFDLRSAVDMQPVLARIYKNGGGYGTERGTAGLSNTTFTEDLAFEMGDLCQLYYKRTGTAASIISNFQMYTAIAYICTVNLD